MTYKTEETLTGAQNLEIGNADFYHQNMRVKWDPFIQRFTTGTLEVVGKSLKGTVLAIDGRAGLVREAETVGEFGQVHHSFFFQPWDIRLEEEFEFEIDIFKTVFTLHDPIAYSKL